MMDVLVVDDNAGSAVTFASLIRRATDLDAGSTHDPDTALRLIRAEPIAVVVLDERMPEMSGTELFGYIRQIDSRVQAIMLTAEANQSEVGRALNLGFSAFVEKKDVQQLPRVVLERFVEFQAERAIEAERTGASVRTPLVLRGRFLPSIRRHRISTTVLYTDVLGKRCAPETAWQTVEQIDAGETITTVTDVSLEEKVIVQTESVRTHGGQLTVGGPQIVTSRLKQSIEKHVLQSVERREMVQRRVQRTLTLPAETQDRDRPQIRSRSRQRAPSCVQVRVTLQLACSCCGQRTFTTLLAYVHDGDYLTRHVDHYSDGERRIVETTDVGSESRQMV